MVIEFNGRGKAEEIKQELRSKVVSSAKKLFLEIILVGSDLVTQSYFKQLQLISVELGIGLIKKVFPQTTEKQEIISYLEKENNNLQVNGILLIVSGQAVVYRLRQEIIDRIKPVKDADYLRSEFIKAENIYYPSVCQAVLISLAEAAKILAVKPEKMAVTLIGNLGFWGKRIEAVLLKSGFESVVGIEKKSLVEEAVSKADIVISCAGSTALIKGEIIKKGAILIDIGLSVVDGELVGDINKESIKEKAAFMTPASGGIGPLATILVYKNFWSHFQSS